MRAIAPDAITQVALVTGKILHEGTGKPVIGNVQITAQEFPLNINPILTNRVLNDGTFVLSGRPELLFPELALRNYQLHLRIRATSVQFRQGFIERSLTVTVPQNWDFEQPVSKEVPTSTSTILVLLPADPVFIRGYVFDADNPELGIANATITVKQGAATFTTVTSADVERRGKYSFQDLVDSTQLRAFKITAANPATIQCSAAGFIFSSERPLAIDFGRSLHEEYFYLVPN